MSVNLVSNYVIWNVLEMSLIQKDVMTVKDRLKEWWHEKWDQN